MLEAWADVETKQANHDFGKGVHKFCGKSDHKSWVDLCEVCIQELLRAKPVTVYLSLAGKKLAENLGTSTNWKI